MTHENSDREKLPNKSHWRKTYAIRTPTSYPAVYTYWHESGLYVYSCHTIASWSAKQTGSPKHEVRRLICAVLIDWEKIIGTRSIPKYQRMRSAPEAKFTEIYRWIWIHLRLHPDDYCNRKQRPLTFPVKTIANTIQCHMWFLRIYLHSRRDMGSNWLWFRALFGINVVFLNP